MSNGLFMQLGPETQSSADPEGSIDLHIEARTHRLIDDTAILLGDAEFNWFVAALENPATPGPKLCALMRRTLAWAV